MQSLKTSLLGERMQTRWLRGWLNVSGKGTLPMCLVRKRMVKERPCKRCLLHTRIDVASTSIHPFDHKYHYYNHYHHHHRSWNPLSRLKIEQKREGVRRINYGYNLHDDMTAESNNVEVTDLDEISFVVNGVRMMGSIVLLPQACYLWKPEKFDEITCNSLQLIAMTNPAVEILLLGCGQKIKHNLNPEIREFLKRNGIVVELIDSRNAAATFNILTAEDRRVAAALLPCGSQ